MNGFFVGVYLVACVFLFIVPSIFVLHDVYEDGAIGRIGLCAIAFSAVLSLGEFRFGDGFPVSPLVAVLAAGFALFLCWHLFRFHRRVLRKREAVMRVLEARGR